MPNPKMSVQLYSVREALAADPDAALARLTELGLQRVEAFDFVRRAPELAALFERHGVQAPTGHACLLSEEIRTANGPVTAPSPAETFTAARIAGVQTVIDPFVAPDRWADEQQIRRTAGLLNQAAEQAAEHGLRVGYHNHSQEFVHSFDGRSAYELFASLLEPEVALEVDLFWAAAGGHDVPALLNRLGEQVFALHIKDGPIVQDPFFSGVPLDPSALAQVAAGQGQVALEAGLAAAPSAEYAVLEFDHYDGDVFDALAGGVKFLQERGVN